MRFSIAPFTGNSPMEPWPALAQAAKIFRPDDGSGETIFFYDAVPPQSLAGSSSLQPVFVLIHGLGDEADSWRHLIPLLNSEGRRVLALDLPGFGRSVAAGRIGLRNHVAAVLKLIEAVVPETPVFMAGNSMGALIAEAAAFAKPRHVRGLVLIDGSIPGGPSNPGLLALVKILFSRKWYRAYRGDDERAWASLYPYYADLDSMPLEDREFLRRRVMARVESGAQEQAYFATQRSLIRAFATSPSGFARKIRRYEGKILLIWGEKDRIIPLSSTDAFRALRPDVELKLVSDAGHLPHQERPVETARLMADFSFLSDN